MEIEHTTADHKLINMTRFLKAAPAGIVVEVGVWKGGSIGYLASIFPERQFFGFDTFEGMPESCSLDNHHKRGDFGDTSFEEVGRKLSGLSNVILVKGLFPASDVTAELPIAMVHCDVDLYESTLAVLRHFHARMQPGGRIYCDDAFQATCEGATLALCQFAAETKKVPQFDLGFHSAFCF